jgi:hypothetical protein
MRPDALGPVTRSDKRAQGIVQFMPATPAERFLLDAFDPAQALPKSAEFRCQRKCSALSVMQSRKGPPARGCGV